jgi:hypothetical protein
VSEEEEVMSLSGGVRLVAGRSQQWRYVGKKKLIKKKLYAAT